MNLDKRYLDRAEDFLRRSRRLAKGDARLIGSLPHSVALDFHGNLTFTHRLLSSLPEGEAREVRLAFTNGRLIGLDTDL